MAHYWLLTVQWGYPGPSFISSRDPDKSYPGYEASPTIEYWLFGEGILVLPYLDQDTPVLTTQGTRLCQVAHYWVSTIQWGYPGPSFISSRDPNKHYPGSEAWPTIEYWLFSEGILVLPSTVQGTPINNIQDPRHGPILSIDYSVRVS